MTSFTARTLALATLTMCAFALNSVFARLALATQSIDPASYTSVRLISGALMLLLLATFRGGLKKGQSEGKFLQTTGMAALFLFTYAAFFSFAYLSVDTGVGALILFTCVQGVMIGWGIYTGERPTPAAWIGIIMALGGFVYLVSPGLSAPDLLGAGLMAISGIAWGIYSLIGRGIKNPLHATARNFIWSVPITLILSAVFITRVEMELHGIILAIASGALTSALGYALWYETLKNFTATEAAILQLTVPVIAAFGGFMLLSEPLSVRVFVASALILGGVALVILTRK